MRACLPGAGGEAHTAASNKNNIKYKSFQGGEGKSCPAYGTGLRPRNAKAPVRAGHPLEISGRKMT